MKKLLCILICLMFIPVVTDAQDIPAIFQLTNFYQVSVFKLPSLRGGQYAISLTPRYTSNPTDFSASSASPTSASLYTSANSTTLFRLGSSILYGISERTTLSVSLECAPGQSAGDRTYSTTLNSQFGNSFSVEKDNLRQDYFSSTLVLSHRFQPNIEFSVTALYNNTNQPINGLAMNPAVTNLVSSNKSRYFDLQASIVIVGN
jgi:hypothetical protein